LPIGVETIYSPELILFFNLSENGIMKL
jgi:hypothetical protein